MDWCQSEAAYPAPDFDGCGHEKSVMHSEGRVQPALRSRRHVYVIEVSTGHPSVVITARSTQQL